MGRILSEVQRVGEGDVSSEDGVRSARRLAPGRVEKRSQLVSDDDDAVHRNVFQPLIKDQNHSLQCLYC